MSQSQIRKAKRRLYKKLKRERRLMKPTKRASVSLNALKPLPTSTSIARKPSFKTALARVVEFEIKKPGQFGLWLDDLHIEHFRAGFQETLDKERVRNEKFAVEAQQFRMSKNEQETGEDSKEQAFTEGETYRPVEPKRLEA